MNTNATTKIYSLTRPELLSISDSNSTCFGGNQDWFLEEEKRKRGCGIVAAGNILMYMSGTATKYSPLYRGEHTRADFTSHICEISRYLKAGSFGIWGTMRFVSGALAFAKARGSCSCTQKINRILYSKKSGGVYKRRA